MAGSTHGKYVIDAAGTRPGRLATAIARLLMGKNKPDYELHVDRGGKVVVSNISQMVFSGKKLDQKLYRHHTMYPGGLKEIPAKKIFKENPAEILRQAVAKMLPKNKFRTNRLKRLAIK
ncbi:MAG: 50S ribosomal protein L13 [Candidatus Magasanikbacteria bacterium]|nr:50S ribosomal protein L13 [Candidatus Magasanikbacteria bacterium]